MAYVDVRKGDVITAELLKELGRGNPVGGVRATGGITSRVDTAGNIQITGKFTGVFWFVVASGGLSARSGSTPGTGSVEIYVKNPSTGTYVDSGIALAVDYISSTTGGVSSGVWGIGGFEDDGTPTVISLDCGN
jgi:hypothetical protein